eukprot:4672234-Amphidinium_carterae.1
MTLILTKLSSSSSWSGRSKSCRECILSAMLSMTEANPSGAKVTGLASYKVCLPWHAWPLVHRDRQTVIVNKCVSSLTWPMCTFRS